MCDRCVNVHTCCCPPLVAASAPRAVHCRACACPVPTSTFPPLPLSPLPHAHSLAFFPALNRALRSALLRLRFSSCSLRFSSRLFSACPTCSTGTEANVEQLRPQSVPYGYRHKDG